MLRRLFVAIGAAGSSIGGAVLGRTLLLGSLEICQPGIRGVMAVGIGAAFGALVFVGLLPPRRGTKLEPGVRFHVGAHWVYQGIRAGAVTGAVAGSSVTALLGAWSLGWGILPLTAIGAAVGLLIGATIVGPLAGVIAAVVALKVARFAGFQEGGDVRRRLRWWVGGVLVGLALAPAIVAVCYDPLETLALVVGFALFVSVGIRWFAGDVIEEMVVVLNHSADSHPTPT
jgi:hypothetical protein